MGALHFLSIVRHLKNRKLEYGYKLQFGLALIIFLLSPLQVWGSTYDQLNKDSFHSYFGLEHGNGMNVNAFSVGGFDPNFVLQKVQFFGYFYNPDNVNIDNCHIALRIVFYKNAGYMDFGNFIHYSTDAYFSAQIQNQTSPGYITFDTDAHGMPMAIPASDLNDNYKVDVQLSYNYGDTCNFDANPSTGVVLYDTLSSSPNVGHFIKLPGSNSAGAFEEYTPYVLFNGVSVYSGKTPILVVPGVLGTEVEKDGELLWADILRMVDPVNLDSFMDPLQFDSDLEPSVETKLLGIIKDKKKKVGNQDFTLYDYSQGLITEFENQGYIENTDLFTFPYDWRYGASDEVVAQLKARIQSIMAQTGSPKVDVVAHSTGGLIVKKYVMENDDHNIRKAVFVGVPNLGAPKAIKVLMVGDNFGVVGLQDAEMKKIAQNLPVVYDLAPSEKYYTAKGSYETIVEPDGAFGSAKTELNHDQVNERLVERYGANSQAISEANALHTLTYDNFDLRTKNVDVYNIVGCKASTPGKIIEVNTTTVPGAVTQFGLESVKGDGTVPLESATNLPVDSDKKFYALKAEHSKMLSQDGLRQQIVNIVSGSSLEVGGDITQDVSKCKLKGKAISIYSPLNIEAIDQNGNRLGLAEDGSLQNDIPNASFDILDEHKFVFLPDDEGQSYTINLKGTGTGVFTLKNQTIDDTVQSTEVFSQIPVTSALSGKLDLTATQSTLVLDSNGDGVSEQILTPSAVLNSAMSEDVIPPTSTPTISGIMGNAGFYRTDVTISLAAQDPVAENNPEEVSGVLKTFYSLDGPEFKVYSSSTPVNVATEGNHALSFYSVDKAGNAEVAKTVEFKIDKTAPEISIQFSPELKDLKFSGSDNFSTSSKIAILDQGDSVTVKDEAGNATQITFKEKDRKNRLNAEIKSLSYNGKIVDTTKTVLRFNWSFSKLGVLQSLTQQVKSKKEFNIFAEYIGGKTVITGKDKNGTVTKILPQLVLPKVVTKEGDFTWTY